MKNNLVIFALLLAGTTFAGNVVEKKVNTFLHLEAQLEILKIDDDLGCDVYCTATVTNTDTGHVFFFPVKASNDDCVTAIVDCQTEAIKRANEFIKNSN